MEIKVIYVNSDGVLQEHNSTEDSIKVKSLKTANYELTDELLGNLVTGGDASANHNHDGRYYLKTEVDQKFSDLIDLAPEALDTLKELADALGDDPNFAANIATQLTSLDGRLDVVEPKVTTLESDMVTAKSNINNLTTRMGVLEAFKNAQVIYVDKDGSDVTGTGGQHKPFASLTAALNSITDASATKRYVIKMAAGNYTEAGNVELKANVFVVGESRDAVRITATSQFKMHSSFSGSADNRSGFSQVSLLSACDFNWANVTSAAGKLYFIETSFGSTVNMYGHNNAIAQAQFTSCVFFGALTISGINVGVFANNVCFSNIVMNQHPNGGMATLLTATGGYCGGTITQNTTVNDFNRRCASFLRSFHSQGLTVNGPASYADATIDSFPQNGATKTNGGNLVQMNQVSHSRFVPNETNAHNLGDWGKQWNWSFGYVHASTGTDLYLISYGSSYAPDSEGRAIGIYTDGAGLQQNVNGGDITLETAETSGTGIRGKVILNGREIDASSKKIVNLADGTANNDAVNKSQLDAAKNDAKAYTDQKVAGLINAAPTVLDTLKELADALGNDPNFATTLSSQIGGLDSRLDDLEASMSAVGSVYTAGAGGVSKGDLLFISGSDVVSKYSDLTSDHNCVGIASDSVAAGGTVRVLANDTKCAGVLSGAAPGSTMYWTGSTFSTSMPSGSGQYVYQVGIARNTTDLAVEVIRVKKNA